MAGWDKPAARSRPGASPADGSPDGEERYARALPYDAPPMPAAMVDREVERIRDGLSEPRPGAAEVRGALAAAGFLPATPAPVTELVATQDGRVWLRREGLAEAEHRWTVLSTDGSIGFRNSSSNISPG
jgi:hypothetical protein